MNTIKMSFKFVDCNDDSTFYSNFWIDDSLIIDLKNVNAEAEEKIDSILSTYDFEVVDDISRRHSIFEYQCCGQIDEDTWKESNLSILVRDKLIKVCRDIKAIGVDIEFDRYTYDFLDGMLPLIKIVNIECDWVKNVNQLYLGKFIYNSANWEYDTEEKEIIEKGIITVNYENK